MQIAGSTMPLDVPVQQTGKRTFSECGCVRQDPARSFVENPVDRVADGIFVKNIRGDFLTHRFDQINQVVDSFRARVTRCAFRHLNFLQGKRFTGLYPLA